MLRPYTRGQAGSRASVELLKARGDRGGDSITSVCHILLLSPVSLYRPPPLPALSWPHGRSPDQVCLQKHTRKQNISMFPVCMQTVSGNIGPLPLQNSFPSFFFFFFLIEHLLARCSLSVCLLLSCGLATGKWSEHGSFMSSNICSVKASNIYQINSCTQLKH